MHGADKVEIREVLIPFVSRADLNDVVIVYFDGSRVLIPFVSRADLNQNAIFKGVSA